MKATTVLLGMGGATSKGREMFTAEFIRGALVQLQNEVENNKLLEVERSGMCPIVATPLLYYMTTLSHTG